MEDLSGPDLPDPYWGTTVRSIRDLSVEVRSDQGVCLWDCSRTLYDSAYGKVVITLIRAGDSDKASRTLESLRREIHVPDEYVHEQSDFEGLRALTPTSWVVTQSPAPVVRVAVGAARGTVLEWVALEYDMCERIDPTIGRCMGTDDGYSLLEMAIWMAERQLEKLIQLGY